VTQDVIMRHGAGFGCDARTPPIRFPHLAACLLGCAVIAFPLHRGMAEQVQLDVHPGLWEVTTTSKSAGEIPMPEEELAKLPPDQRAKFEAAMKQAMARATAPHTFKECVTEQQIKNGFKPPENAGISCKRTVLSSTTRLLEIHEECIGHGQTSGNFRLEAPDPATIAGTVDMVVTQGARTMTMKNHMTGKWLGADCGDIKPGSMKAQ
jgi:hypothetical protein